MPAVSQSGSHGPARPHVALESCDRDFPLRRSAARRSPSHPGARPMTHRATQSTGVQKGGLRAAVTAALAAGVLAGCAVGPNFKTPAPPHTTGYVPAGQLPPMTAPAPPPGG